MAFTSTTVYQTNYVFDDNHSYVLSLSEMHNSITCHLTSVEPTNPPVTYTCGFNSDTFRMTEGICSIKPKRFGQILAKPDKIVLTFMPIDIYNESSICLAVTPTDPQLGELYPILKSYLQK